MVWKHYRLFLWHWVLEKKMKSLLFPIQQWQQRLQSVIRVQVLFLQISMHIIIWIPQMLKKKLPEKQKQFYRFIYSDKLPIWMRYKQLQKNISSFLLKMHVKRMAQHTKGKKQEHSGMPVVLVFIQPKIWADMVMGEQLPQTIKICMKKCSCCGIMDKKTDTNIWLKDSIAD